MNATINELIKYHSPGYDILVYRDNKTSEYIYGSMDGINKVTSNTLYDIASLTKLFTCTLVYMAYEEKRIDIYETIYNIDSNFINLKEVRVIDLIKHNQDIWTNGYLGSINNKEEFYTILYSAYVKNKYKKYVDTHYIILGVLLEKIYNKTFEELCIEKIFSKLGMLDTTFNPDPKRCASNNYETIENSIIDTNYPGIVHDKKAKKAKEFGLNLGHASIFTTGCDMLKFLKSFLDNTLLKKETIEFMLQHEDIDSYNYNMLKENIGGYDINAMYNEMIDKNIELPVFKTYNNCGTRYKSKIIALNDVPYNASDNSITFSGYTGPMFTIDFDNKIIILVMCNVLFKTKLSRYERRYFTFKIIDTIYNEKN